MKIIEYFSNLVIPLVFLLILVYGLKEKKQIFELFLEGVNDGIKIVWNIFPTLIGFFVAVGALRSSGLLNDLINLLSPITNLFGFPEEIMPLAFIRPISGSTSIAVGTDIMKQYGVDSKIGLIAATIMGSTETTLYIIAIYSSQVKVKKTRKVLLAALVGDIIGILVSVVFWNIMS